jgi:DNA-binding beta-propeller fold protein YncE
MVSLLLVAARRIALSYAVLLAADGCAAATSRPKPSEQPLPQLEMDGGRTLRLERNFSSEQEVKTKRGFWTKLVDVVIGAPQFRSMARPYSVATDSRGRVIVTDPGAMGVHIFDFERQKYKFLWHTEGRDEMRSPQCVAVDVEDNIYVTDSEAGMIFVFAPGGKFLRTIGSLKRGEGIFKRPTGIAVDSARGVIYVTDTLRDQVFLVDMQGSVLKRIGKRGAGPGEFNYPTEVRLHGDDLLVVDAMNSRVQRFDRMGEFRSVLDLSGGDGPGTFRLKGIAFDSEGHLYLADALSNVVLATDLAGQLLYYFGAGAGVGDFLLPAGVAIDRHDRIFVVDSYRRRIQTFQYTGVSNSGGRNAQ